MGSFGSQSSKQEASSSSGINKKFLPYALDALDRAEQVGNQGYVPYQGMDVALPDSVISSWQRAADRNAAFNTPGQSAENVRASMPLTTQNGVQGLSSHEGYQDQLAKLKESSPGLYDYIKSFAIDPVTGKPGERTMDTLSKIKQAAASQQGGFPQYSLQQMIAQGAKTGGGMGAMAGFMGIPYYDRGQGGMTSTYKQLYDNQILNRGLGGGSGMAQGLKGNV